MEAGSDEAYRDQLDPELVYKFNNTLHGKTAKRSIEGPQICTRAKELDPKVIKGADSVVIKQQFQYRNGRAGKRRIDVGAENRAFRAGSDFSSPAIDECGEL